MFHVFLLVFKCQFLLPLQSGWKNIKRKEGHMGERPLKDPSSKTTRTDLWFYERWPRCRHNQATTAPTKLDCSNCQGQSSELTLRYCPLLSSQLMEASTHSRQTKSTRQWRMAFLWISPKQIPEFYYPLTHLPARCDICSRWKWIRCNHISWKWRRCNHY